jgi:hypothetical protein
MSQYDFKYRIQSAPQAAINGSGMVMFDVFAVARITGSGDPFSEVPGYHKTAPVSSIDLKICNDMPDSTQPQRTAKNTAIKNLLAAALGTGTYNIPPTLWDIGTLQAYMDANDSAVLETSRLNDYVTNVLHVTFPLDLVL